MGRSSIRAKASRLTSTTPTASAASNPSASNPTNKKSLRIARHSAFVSRIEKSSSKAATPSSRSRRRKSANQLATSLSTLADSLPDATSSDSIAANVNFVSQSSRDHIAAGKNKEKQSIKSRPGAMKRKENMVKSECERFGKNLAIIETVRNGDKKEGQEAPVAAEKTNSWAMLRNFIGNTLEKKEEFVEREKNAGVAMEVES